LLRELGPTATAIGFLVNALMIAAEKLRGRI
jgi:hypothetical protein